ncbi:MAG: hypothetical protein HW421_3917 [Ignavibacteria bacterium]|nr:hypothetical protein [Ignavibacteria bacterium]
MELITIKTFENSFEANLLKSRLEDEGIECFLFDENTVSIMPFYNVAVGGIKLKINEADIDKARDIFEDINHTLLTDERNNAIRCPKCDSNDIILGFKSIKSITGIILFVYSLLFLLFPIYYKKLYKCKNCGEEFRK